ncbi:hypothetical protein IE077_001247, partial [Cardiosporidium cionae]
VVDFLCKHYPDYLHGFSSIWLGGQFNSLPYPSCKKFAYLNFVSDEELEKDRMLVVDFLKSQKLPCHIASHFVNAGFDTLDTLCTLTVESLDEIEKFNKASWLPGHKVRLQQAFSDIAGRVHTYQLEKRNLAFSPSGTCTHQTVVSKTSVLPSHAVSAQSILNFHFTLLYVVRYLANPISTQ